MFDYEAWKALNKNANKNNNTIKLRAEIILT